MISTEQKGKEFNQMIVEYIHQGIKSVIENMYEESKKEFIERLDREKAKAISGMAIQLFKSVDIMTIGDKITIQMIDRK